MFSLHISNISAQNKGIAKKLILSLRAIMVSQEVDLVAGDLMVPHGGTAGKDNLSTSDEAFMDSILPSPPGPSLHCGDLGPFWTNGRKSVDFSHRLAPSDAGK